MLILSALIMQTLTSKLPLVGRHNAFYFMYLVRDTGPNMEGYDRECD